ncbi:membrane protein [Corynebacterium diphtheriae]|nr:membrane protein [Corynebacterium diphtheriae]
MNIRITKIVAPLVAMALCTPNIAFAQEESNQKTISGRTEVNGDFSLTRSISAINRNDSKPQDSKTIYVNPGDTINVKLELQGKTANKSHGFTSFTEEVSPIQEFSASLGSLTVKKTGSPEPYMKQLDNLGNDIFRKTGERTIEFKVDSEKSRSGFGDIGNQITIDYSYTAGNIPGKYTTQFIPNDPRFTAGSSVFDPEKLNLTIVVNGEEENRPPRGGDERPTPPESNRSTVFSWLTKALGVLAFLGGTVWFIIKHIFRL